MAAADTIVSRYGTSVFIAQHAPVLFRCYRLTFRYAYDCADYFITDIRTGEKVSKDILFVMDRLQHCLVISRFYPELYLRDHSKYLSATCFYLMVHHFFHISLMDSSTTIYLTAKPSVFTKFYRKLKDFDFHIHGPESSRYVPLISEIERSNVDTSMIVEAKALNDV
jgi:hypothetical protein